MAISYKIRVMGRSLIDWTANKTTHDRGPIFFPRAFTLPPKAL